MVLGGLRGSYEWFEGGGGGLVRGPVGEVGSYECYQGRGGVLMSGPTSLEG